MAPFLRDADVLLCADCVGYALGGLPREIAEGRVLAIACPKLDDGQEIYVEKLVAMIDHARIRSITVARMEVPCCRGLVGLALQAQRRAERQVPVSEIVVSIDGGMIREATTRSAGMKDKKATLKDIIRALHKGLPVEKARDRVRNEIGSISTQELVEIEQALMDEGLPPDEVTRFCNVHVLLVQDSLEEPGAAGGPAGRPTEMLQKENTAIRGIAGRLRQIVAGKPRAGEVAAELAKLAGLEGHYAIKENVIFPYLEKHGFPGPSKVMWQKDNEIRGLLKAATSAVADAAKRDPSAPVPANAVKEQITPLLDEVLGMIDKEEQILLPAAAERFTAEEWARAAIEMDELGFPFLGKGQGATVPRPAAAPAARARPRPPRRRRHGAASLGPLFRRRAHAPAQRPAL